MCKARSRVDGGIGHKGGIDLPSGPTIKGSGPRRRPRPTAGKIASLHVFGVARGRVHERDFSVYGECGLKLSPLAAFAHIFSAPLLISLQASTLLTSPFKARQMLARLFLSVPVPGEGIGRLTDPPGAGRLPCTGYRSCGRKLHRGSHCGDSRQGGREWAPVMSPSSAKRAGSTWFVYARCLLGEGACGRSPVLPAHFLPVSTRDCRHSSN